MAIRHRRVPGDDGELVGRPVDAAWDLVLRAALEQRGVRVDEELVLPALIDYLRAAVPST